MRRGIRLAGSIVVVLMLAGCAASAPSGPQPAPSEPTVLGTSHPGSPTALATQSKAPDVRPADPAVAEGIPASFGMQASLTDGKPAVTQARAMEIASKHRPVGATSVDAMHVLYSSAKSRADDPSTAGTPLNAWMVTFHGGKIQQTPVGSSPSSTGNVTVFVDASSGTVLETVEYVSRMK